VTEVGATDRSILLWRIAFGLWLPALAQIGCDSTYQLTIRLVSISVDLVSISSTFQKLIPTLDERLGESSSAILQSGLTFVTDKEAIALIRKKSGLVLTDVLSKSVVRIDQMPMMQLLSWYRSAEDLMIADEIQVAKAFVPVVNALFPRSNPYVWWGYRF
jgi:hypothetical protein